MRSSTTISILTMTMTMTMACGGDDSGAAGPTSEATSNDPTAESTGSTTMTATLDPDDGSSSGSDPTAQSSSSGADSSDGSSSASDTTGGEQGEYAALVRGTLFTDDLDAAQAVHDPLAAGGKAGAMALGDFAHDVVLGTTLLGTTENEFVAIDRWTNLEGAMTVYGDPAFQKGFAMLFAEPVAPMMFERRADWHGWGDLDAADDEPAHTFVVVRGHLLADDLVEAQTLHDQLASGGEGIAMPLGDVAHVVWLGVEDPHEFFAVDVWTSNDAIEAFYSNPDFQAGFAMLFSGPPSVGVYGSTDWAQW
jgi:hypothetical protein